MLDLSLKTSKQKILCFKKKELPVLGKTFMRMLRIRINQVFISIVCKIIQLVTINFIDW